MEQSVCPSKIKYLNLNLSLKIKCIVSAFGNLADCFLTVELANWKNKANIYTPATA